MNFCYSGHVTGAPARTLKIFFLTFLALVLLHYPLLSLPYFWDEAGYYIPAALDFSRSGLLIPQSTWRTGHPPLVIVYLGLAWRFFGFSPLVTRSAMILVAAATVVTVYALGRRVAGGEAAAWSALLLAVSPLFYAQSALAHLDLAAALFTTLAVLALLIRNVPGFSLAASLAILSKETAAIFLLVAWAYAWRARRELSPTARFGLAVPLLPLVAWTAYYHHSTGYWTGNREYLEYNFYATLNPARVPWSLLRRLYELLLGGFNWVLIAGAAIGSWRGQRLRPHRLEDQPEEERCLLCRFLFLAGGLSVTYVVMLSLVGGAILPRYLLPVFPSFFLVSVLLVGRLPRRIARGILVAATACFVSAWFLNPPYPFPFEDNLSYADFVRLHQQAARFLESRPAGTRILTAWPASDELTRPFLGYVRKPLVVVPVRGFTAHGINETPPESFDLLYLYSRSWEPRINWLTRFAGFEKLQENYFDYAPQIREDILVARYGLRLLVRYERRGQWVNIYAK